MTNSPNEIQQNPQQQQEARNNEDDSREPKPRTDSDGNEITARGKQIAGGLLFIFTLIPCLGIIAYWPDGLPKPGGSSIYFAHWFQVRLAGVAELKVFPKAPTIHLNTLLLLLVALGGFMGNMIHVATSLTTFVGAGKFRKSWILWYFIKPFTASALAICLYFVFRGGFLNMSDGGATINLYGLMTISIFAGLFTDKATEKLKEVFEVLFKSNTQRPDAMQDAIKIASIVPQQIEKDKDNSITLTGEKLDTIPLKITINNEAVDSPQITANSITFIYKIPDTQKDKTDFTVSVKDEKGKEYYTATLTLKTDSSTPNNDATTNDPGLG